MGSHLGVKECGPKAVAVVVVVVAAAAAAAVVY